MLVLAVMLLVLAMSGCAKPQKHEVDIERQGEKFREQSRSRAVMVTTEPYIGAKAVELGTDADPVLNRHVTLKKKGTLSQITAAIGELVSLPVQVGADAEGTISPAAQAPKQTPPAIPQAGQPGVNLELESLLSVPGGTGKATTPALDALSGRQLSISYDGPLRGLLDQVAVASGYGWDFEKQSGSIVFARMMVRTFTLLGAPGTVTFENKVTNKSKENSSSTISGSQVNSAVSSSDTAAQTAQSTGTKLSFDIFGDTEKAVKALLSPKGAVVINQAAGTLTVRDTPDSVRRVATFVEDINSRLGRQVALTVQVWSLSISDNTDIGFNLQGIFEDKELSIAAGSLTNVGNLNTATATIVSGKLKGSSAVLQALRQWGNASQVTSAGGLVMSNQPVPVMAIERHAYLASAGTSTTNYQQTTELTPGEVTTGFAMTVIPHILDQRRVILQYNINLSALEEMKEIETSDITLQLPQTSTRAFAQRSAMRMGQTLVLCGFEKQSTDSSTSLGIPTTKRTAKSGRTLLVITIQVESAEV
ncbi:secretin N-terminal domain-containing protein [Fundidesulfovibrio putealis]|uniref:secretin N-terminal domain-containing protein n=1 Tax=Fundidesulfovibrio putealis TaxID=270496 RepID=UPI0005B947BA|nr:secretin N-terminal domain-containing protein [Fundidesulfovibrio putealis]